MKNMLTDMDTNVTLEIHKWLNLHKEEFENRHYPCRHTAYMCDDDSNMYAVAVIVKKVEWDEEQREI